LKNFQKNKLFLFFTAESRSPAWPCWVSSTAL